MSNVTDILDSISVSTKPSDMRSVMTVLKALHFRGVVQDMDPELESFLKTLPNIENSKAEAEKYCEELRAILRRKLNSTSKPTKVIEFDSFPGGFPAGQLAVFSARGSERKSLLASKLLSKERVRRGYLEKVSLEQCLQIFDQDPSVKIKQPGVSDQSASKETERLFQLKTTVHRHVVKPKHSGYPGSGQYGASKRKGK